MKSTNKIGKRVYRKDQTTQTEESVVEDAKGSIALPGQTEKTKLESEQETAVNVQLE